MHQCGTAQVGSIVTALNLIRWKPISPLKHRKKTTNPTLRLAHYNNIFNLPIKALYPSFRFWSWKPFMASAQTCYFPDGSEATSDTPCRSALIGDGPSACCNSLDACLDNHLCLEQLGGPMISRGSCTDETWQSPECSQYCADGKNNLQQSRALALKRLEYGFMFTLTSILQLAAPTGNGYILCMFKTTRTYSAVARRNRPTTPV